VRHAEAQLTAAVGCTRPQDHCDALAARILGLRIPMHRAAEARAGRARCACDARCDRSRGVLRLALTYPSR